MCSKIRTYDNKNKKPEPRRKKRKKSPLAVIPPPPTPEIFHEDIFDDNDSIRSDFWQDSFDKYFNADKMQLKQANVLKKQVRADYNADSSVETVILDKRSQSREGRFRETFGDTKRKTRTHLDPNAPLTTNVSTPNRDIIHNPSFPSISPITTCTPCELNANSVIENGENIEEKNKGNAVDRRNGAISDASSEQIHFDENKHRGIKRKSTETETNAKSGKNKKSKKAVEFLGEKLKELAVKLASKTGNNDPVPPNSRKDKIVITCSNDNCEQEVGKIIANVPESKYYFRNKQKKKIDSILKANEDLLKERSNADNNLPFRYDVSFIKNFLHFSDQLSKNKKTGKSRKPNAAKQPKKKNPKPKKQKPQKEKNPIPIEEPIPSFSSDTSQKSNRILSATKTPPAIKVLDNGVLTSATIKSVTLDSIHTIEGVNMQLKYLGTLCEKGKRISNNDISEKLKPSKPRKIFTDVIVGDSCESTLIDSIGKLSGEGLSESDQSMLLRKESINNLDRSATLFNINQVFNLDNAGSTAKTSLQMGFEATKATNLSAIRFIDTNGLNKKHLSFDAAMQRSMSNRAFKCTATQVKSKSDGFEKPVSLFEEPSFQVPNVQNASTSKSCVLNEHRTDYVKYLQDKQVYSVGTDTSHSNKRASSVERIARENAIKKYSLLRTTARRKVEKNQNEEAITPIEHRRTILTETEPNLGSETNRKTGGIGTNVGSTPNITKRLRGRPKKSKSSEVEVTSNRTKRSQNNVSKTDSRHRRTESRKKMLTEDCDSSETEIFEPNVEIQVAPTPFASPLRGCPQTVVESKAEVASNKVINDQECDIEIEGNRCRRDSRTANNIDECESSETEIFEPNLESETERNIEKTKIDVAPTPIAKRLRGYPQKKAKLTSDKVNKNQKYDRETEDICRQRSSMKADYGGGYESSVKEIFEPDVAAQNIEKTTTDVVSTPIANRLRSCPPKAEQSKAKETSIKVIYDQRYDIVREDIGPDTNSRTADKAERCRSSQTEIIEANVESEAERKTEINEVNVVSTPIQNRLRSRAKKGKDSKPTISNRQRRTKEKSREKIVSTISTSNDGREPSDETVLAENSLKGSIISSGSQTSEVAEDVASKANLSSLYVKYLVKNLRVKLKRIRIDDTAEAGESKTNETSCKVLNDQRCDTQTDYICRPMDTRTVDNSDECNSSETEIFEPNVENEAARNIEKMDDVFTTIANRLTGCPQKPEQCIVKEASNTVINDQTRDIEKLDIRHDTDSRTEGTGGESSETDITGSIIENETEQRTEKNTTNVASIPRKNRLRSRTKKGKESKATISNKLNRVNEESREKNVSTISVSNDSDEASETEHFSQNSHIGSIISSRSQISEANKSNLSSLYAKYLLRNLRVRLKRIKIPSPDTQVKVQIEPVIFSDVSNTCIHEAAEFVEKNVSVSIPDTPASAQVHLERLHNLEYNFQKQLQSPAALQENKNDSPCNNKSNEEKSTNNSNLEEQTVVLDLSLPRTEQITKSKRKTFEQFKENLKSLKKSISWNVHDSIQLTSRSDQMSALDLSIDKASFYSTIAERTGTSKDNISSVKKTSLVNLSETSANSSKSVQIIEEEAGKSISESLSGRSSTANTSKLILRGGKWRRRISFFRKSNFLTHYGSISNSIKETSNKTVEELTNSERVSRRVTKLCDLSGLMEASKENSFLLAPTDDEAPNLPPSALLDNSTLGKKLQNSLQYIESIATAKPVVDFNEPTEEIDQQFNDFTTERRRTYQQQLSTPYLNRQTSVVSPTRRRRTSFVEEIRSSGTNPFNQLGLLPIEPSIHLQHPHLKAGNVVLRRCGQSEPIEFSSIYSEENLLNCQKIGEGVYGEVFMKKTKSGEAVVLKIIPIEGTIEVNGEPQKKFDQILSEIIITMELSKLRHDKELMTSGFVEVKNVRCVQGCYPDHLIDLWELYRDNCGTENDHPGIFPEDQLYIVLELANSGKDLEAFTFQNALQSYSAFVQTALTLAVAEKKFQFEHRDLHWGNILLTHTEDKLAKFIINGTEIKVPTHGVKVTIIDFTLSRMVFDGCCLYNNLSNDEELFSASGDYQFDIYRFMKQRLDNDWQRYEPHTNILWLHYTIDKMINGARYQNTKSKKHRSAINDMMQLRDELLDFESASEYVDGLN